MDLPLTGQELASLSQLDAMNMVAASGAIGVVGTIVIVALIVFYCIVFWRLFKKAGYEGYESLIKGHNGYLMILMSGKPGWWYFLFMIPVVLFVLSGAISETNAGLGGAGVVIAALVFLFLYVVISNGIAKKFGKRVGFALGLIVLPFIFYPILAFGKAKFKK